MMPLLAITGLILFGCSSFFFALGELALFSLGKWQVKQLEETHGEKGRRVAQLLSQPQDLLATIVLGNAFSNAGLVGIGIWMALEGHFYLPLVILALFVLILFGCEIAPKALAVRAPETWALRVAQPMWFLVKLSRPFRKVAQRCNDFLLRTLIPKNIKPQNHLSDEDYQELLDLAHQQGTLGAAEKEIILEIISLDRRTAKDVMRPRSRMACISDDLTQEEMVEEARRYKHRRLPIYDQTPDTIVGVLNTWALLLDPKVDLAEVIEFPSFVPESMNLLHLLRSLQKQRRGMAVVLDEYGSTAGIVTLEDILQEIVGTVRGEGNTSDFLIERLGQERWRVNGTMRVEDFRRDYPGLQEDPDVETMGGLFLKALEVLPAAGQSTQIQDLRFTALVIDERRIKEILVETNKKR